MKIDNNNYRFDDEIDRREVPALKYHPKVLGQGGKSLFPCGVADMDFRAPPAVLDALLKRLEHGIFGYEAVPDGLTPALIQWLKTRHGWLVEETQILRAPNVLNALAMATSLFTNEGDGVIVQPPVFFDFFDIIRENNRRLKTNPLLFKDGRYEMDFEDLERKASDPRTKLLYLCSPHNPVGRVWHQDELAMLGDICANYGVLVISDEIHADLVYPDHRHTPFAALGQKYAENSIICLSPAKSFNIASCCSAFTVIADSEKRARFQSENSRLTVNKNNAFANVAMEAAYRHATPWLDQLLLYLQTNLRLVRDRLSETPVDLIEPEGTFLLWLDFRQLGLSPDELTEFLREEARWAASRGQAFGRQGRGFARVNIACTHAKLEAALDDLCNALNKFTA